MCEEPEIYAHSPPRASKSSADSKDQCCHYLVKNQLPLSSSASSWTRNPICDISKNMSSLHWWWWWRWWWWWWWWWWLWWSWSWWSHLSASSSTTASIVLDTEHLRSMLGRRRTFNARLYLRWCVKFAELQSSNLFLFFCSHIIHIHPQWWNSALSVVMYQQIFQRERSVYLSCLSPNCCNAFYNL